MRIAFVSDIHANLAAWNAVLADTSARSVDKIICLGDIVGYGPQPAEVLSSVYANVDYFVLGNHDAVVGGLMEPSGFNPLAGKLIEHTRSLLGVRAHRFFRQVPLLLRHAEFEASHGSVSAPGKFLYLTGERDARDAWRKSSSSLIFAGHTHALCLHALAPGDRYRRLKSPSGRVPLQTGHRYIVNCGSVGLSRSGDFRAGYVIYDTGAKTVSWRRLPYDLQSFCRAVRSTYADPKLAGFLLKRVERCSRSPVRELIDFTPGRSTVSAEVTVKRDINQIRGRLRRWRLAAIAALFLLLLIASGVVLGFRRLPRSQTIGAEVKDLIRPRLSLDGWIYDYMLSESHAGRPLPQSWSAALSDAGRQSVRYAGGRLEVSSKEKRPLTVFLQPISTEHIRRIKWEIDALVSGHWDGETPVLVLDYTADDGSVTEGAYRVALREVDGAMQRTRTLALPAGTAAVRPRMYFNAAGFFLIDSISAELMPTDEKSLLLRGPLDLNSASAADLESIPGVGPALSGRIVKYRRKEGGFKNVDELIRVSGIGEVTLERIKKYVVVE